MSSSASWNPLFLSKIRGFLLELQFSFFWFWHWWQPLTTIKEFTGPFLLSAPTPICLWAAPLDLELVHGKVLRISWQSQKIPLPCLGGRCNEQVFQKAPSIMEIRRISSISTPGPLPKEGCLAASKTLPDHSYDVVPSVLCKKCIFILGTWLCIYFCLHDLSTNLVLLRTSRSAVSNSLWCFCSKYIKKKTEILMFSSL